MPAFNNVNIKDLTKIEEVVSGNLLLIETENGTNTIDFDNFVVGPDNVSWYTAFETVSGQVASLSADLSQVNFTERSALTALSAEVQLIETQFYALTSNVTALSSNFLALSSNLINPSITVFSVGGTGTGTFPARWNTVKITMIGGGGGGGGASSAVNAAGGGGGSGAVSIGYFNNVGGRTFLYKVGIGGAGGANTGGTGSAGDLTHVTIPVFGANFGISANGGSGGTGNTTTGNAAAGGAGGSSSGGGNASFTFSGTQGGTGVASTTLVNAFGGNGGPGLYGQGNGLGNVGQSAGAGGAGTFGAGGGGGRVANVGGQGGAGFIMIEYIS